MVIVLYKNFFSVKKTSLEFDLTSNQTSIVLTKNQSINDDILIIVFLIRSLVKDNMTLYQHSAHCSSAMQWFLDENPEYWPFIPIKNVQNNESEEIEGTR